MYASSTLLPGSNGIFLHTSYKTYLKSFYFSLKVSGFLPYFNLNYYKPLCNKTIYGMWVKYDSSPSNSIESKYSYNSLNGLKTLKSNF